MRQSVIVSVLAVVVVLVSACSPSLSPLYRDYEIAERDTSMAGRIEVALEKAGWTVIETDVPNAVSTEERVLSDWGIYRVTAWLEVTPLGSDHVRVYVHPYRKYFIGNRGKIPFLSKSLRGKFLADLNRSFEEQGLTPVGTPMQRDRVASN